MRPVFSIILILLSSTPGRAQYLTSDNSHKNNPYYSMTDTFLSAHQKGQRYLQNR